MSTRSQARWAPIVVVLAAVLLDGCGMTPTVTSRSSIEQRLIVRSLERAVAKIDVTALASKRVAVDLVALTNDQVFAKPYVAALLKRRGVLVVDDAGSAELKLQVFAPALGVDQGQTLIGMPQTVVPLLGLSIPEIALFKWVRHRGITEIAVYSYDGRDGRLIEAAVTGFGQAKYDRFTVLLVIGFGVTDLEDRPPSGRGADRGIPAPAAEGVPAPAASGSTASPSTGE
jgi:hypothetical protein